MHLVGFYYTNYEYITIHGPQNVKN